MLLGTTWRWDSFSGGTTIFVVEENDANRPLAQDALKDEVCRILLTADTRKGAISLPSPADSRKAPTPTPTDWIG